MNVLPPVLIVLDTNVLLAGNTRDWQTFSRVGECFVPKVVLEELEFIANGGAEAEAERVAREFSRFYPESNWKPTHSIATHPSLKPAAGHDLSKKARHSLAVAQTCYGLARNRPEGLVVLVSNDQPLVQRLRQLETPNLCGVPLAAFLQWTRSNRRPAVVTQQLQAVRPAAGVVPTATPRRATPTAPRPTVVSQSSRSQSARPAPASSGRRSLRLQQTFYNLVSLALLALVIGGFWRVASPATFARFWQQLPIPAQMKK